MKIGIYDPYLDTLSGGEKYMLSIALCLQDDHEVVIFWDKAKEQEIRSKAKERFGFDLEKIAFAPSLFSKSVSFLTRYNKSKDYDLLFYLSDGSLPVVACDLIVHFQSPMLWLKGRSLKNRLKMRRIKTVICNSNFTKSYVDKIFGIESKIVYPPVSIQGRYQPTKKSGSSLTPDASASTGPVRVLRSRIFWPKLLPGFIPRGSKVGSWFLL